MKEWDIAAVLAERIRQDMAGAWARVKAYYDEIGQSAELDGIAGLEGLTQFYDDNYGITLRDFTYSTPEVVQRPIVASTRTYQNDGNTEITDEFQFTKTMEESFTFRFTEGLKVGTKATASIGLPLVGESEVELSAEITFQADEEWSKTETKEWTLRTTVPVPPHSNVKVTGFITNAAIDATFSGVAKATRGLVLTWFRMEQGGYTEFPVPLVVLLPESQRTVPLSGSFRGVEGINAYTRVEDVAGA